MKISNEVKVGFIALLSIFTTYFGFNYLKGNNPFKEVRQYYGVYPRVDGLSIDNKVQLNGFNIGRVNMIQLMTDNSGNIVVGFTINVEHIKIPDNTIAKISSLDLFGTKAVEIFPGDSKTEAQIGDTLVSDIEGDIKAEVDKRLRPLEQKTNQLIASIDSVVTTVQAILSEDARKNLKESLESINRSFASLEKTSYRVDELVQNESASVRSIIENTNAIVTNLKNNNDKINHVIENFTQITDSIAAADFVGTLKKAGVAMESVANIMEKVDKGEGTIGQLMNNDSLYVNMTSATKELDRLLEDMRENPHRYVHFSVFGRKDKADKKKK